MLKKKIQDAMFTALKEGKKDEVEILRFFLARLKNLEIDKQKELTDEEVIALIQKLIKELDESMASFEKGGRGDLLSQAKKQKEIISQFLPPQLDDEALEAELKKIIEQNQEVYQKNKKAIIGVAIKALRGKATSERIVSKLNSLLK